MVSLTFYHFFIITDYAYLTYYSDSQCTSEYIYTVDTAYLGCTVETYNQYGNEYTGPWKSASFNCATGSQSVLPLDTTKSYMVLK